MDAHLQKFLHKYQHLKIQLDEIKSATDNFNVENCIGVGGYGKVYKGEVSHYRGRSMVAIKRLSSSGGQGTPEFLIEITTLSRYNHENLISLVGFCYEEEEEMILVYEHASRGSLDRYLNSPHLAWPQRIKICLDAAKGLNYLHDPGETHQRIIHRDIKSSNILLDYQWNAKLSDLGLSIVGSANEQQSVIVTLAAGTLGYIDPEYMMTHTLTKESDIYSFGVVLFEVLCGKLCYTQKTLLPTWIESYKQNKVYDIIFKSLTIQSVDQGSIKIFSDLAYRCLNESREGRPLMTEVITELKTALESQEFSERKQLFDYEEITWSAEPLLSYRSKFELWKLLFKGVLLNEGRTWFSLNKKGEHCEMISIAECLDADTYESDNSRFAVGPYYLCMWQKYKVCVKTQFLSPGITYTMNLMCRINESAAPLGWVSLEYNLEGETKTSRYVAFVSNNGDWWMCELYQFTSDQIDHEIVFELEADTDIVVDGIDFCPVEQVEHTETYEKQLLSDSASDANWEEKLPTDFECIIKQSKDDMQWRTKKEAYSVMRKGFLINAGEEWFSVDDNGKKCYMLSARAIFGSKNFWGVIQSSPESRFGEAYQCSYGIPSISCKIKLELVSSETTYATYLVYKLPNDLSKFDGLVQVDDGRYNHWCFLLARPETPVIRPKADQNTHNPMSRLPKTKGLPRQRDDGWMEVQIWEFQTHTTTEDAISMHLNFEESCARIIIQGVEVRPG